MKHHKKNKFRNKVFENKPEKSIQKKPEESIQKFEGKFQIKRISDAELKYCMEVINKLKKEIGKVVIGQERILDGLMRGLICNGHVLLEGVPGIAKTLIIRALGQATGCSVNRIQFTVDLLPTDIIGIISYTPQKGFEVVKGPIFANFLIADEINRSPPKTQSALIEGMQEKQVTIGKVSYPLPGPFFVMATKNPVESVGVFSLPEAQIDRFLFNLVMDYPKRNEEKIIMEENITLNKFEDFKLKPVISPDDILKLQEHVRGIYLSDSIKSYILSIVNKTRDKNFFYSDCIAYGASPRASIALFIASKAKALIEGRNFVLPEDVKEVVFDVMRHRIIPTYKSTIKGVTIEQIIRAILDETRVE
jgi:MoxR-like ATPase